MLLNSYGSYYHMKRSTEIRLSFGKGNKMQTSSTVISLYKSSPTLIKIKRKFANSRLKKNTKDPEECITELEELRDRLEDMGSIMSDEDIMIHILNNLPS